MNDLRLLDYLDHMLQAATEACGFVDGLSKDDFLDDKRTQRAVVMSLVIVGEAAAKIMDTAPEFVATQTAIPWRSMRGMRNRIAHGYFDINLDVVWETVKSALPTLIGQLPDARDHAARQAPRPPASR